MKLRLLTIFLLIAGFAFAQDPIISLDVSTKDDDSGKKLAGSVVEVYKDGKLFISKTSASNGQVPLIDLPIGANYKIVIKKPGYVAKVATLDAHYDYPEDLPPVVPFPIQTSLFQEVEGVDFKWLETTPMIKFNLDQYGQQTWDKGYTSDMLKKIEDLKKEMADKAAEDAKKQADFDAYVKTADGAISKKDYETAITNYDKALAIFNDKPDVKKKRDDAQKALDDLKAGEELEKKFQEKMSAAKDKFDAKSYKEALTLYKEATALKPNEALPKTRIAEIEKLLADEKANEDKFNKLVVDGDKAVGTEAYDDAIKNYEEALVLKDDAGVKTKLENAKKKKQEKLDADAAAKEKEAKYNQLIADADKAFDSKSYTDARAKYAEALTIKAGESHPSARISAIDEILNKQKADEDAKKKLEEDYKKLITEADAAFASKKWQESITKYEAALKLKAVEKYPTDQIKLAQKSLADEAEKNAKDAKYTQLMTEAKALKDSEKYQEAIAKYKEALAEKPSESEPTTKIAEIEKLLKDQASAKELEAKYQKHMADGNSAQTGSNLTKALEEFQAALTTKPGDANAQKKVDEIKKLITDKEAAEANEKKFNDLVAAGDKNATDKSYTDAKVNYQKALGIKDDQGVKDKIKQMDELIAKTADAEEQKKKYDAAIKAADEAFNAKDWEKALSKYEEAFAIKEDAYPKERIATVKGKIAENADAEAKQKLFTDLVAEGDKLGAAKSYDEAIKKYSEAIKIKPDVNVSKKIVDLEELKKQDAANNDLNTKYLAKIKEADAAFNSKSWDAAKTLYNDAIGIKGSEQYPKDQLLEIDKKMKEESQSEIETQYQKILTVAQGKMDEEDFDKAIELYNRAKDMKPSDPLPQKKIDEINEIKKQKEAEKADKAAFDKKYADLIVAADKDAAAKSYQEAVKKYKEALNMKPSESYPKTKIAELEKLIADEAAKGDLEAKYLAAVKKADDLFAAKEYNDAKSAYQDALDIKSTEEYPKTKIAECNQKLKDQSENEIEEQYQKILTVAQKKMDEKDFDRALELFNRAKDMKPSDPLPQQRIDEINQLLKDLDADKAKRKKFDDLIQQADTQFEKGEFEKALPIYMAALDIFNEKYPTDQVAACRAKMKKDDSAINKEYEKLIAKADEYFDAANYDKATNLYERAVGIKPSDPYPKNRLKEIYDILHPPKNHIANSNGLKDYGPAVNERPIDIEAMLVEAEEQSRYIEYEKIYQQRIDANAADAENSDAQKEENFKSDVHVDKIKISSEKVGETGELGRQAVTDNVGTWQVDLTDQSRRLYDDQENDIQFQNKRKEAMTIEIEENYMDNDLPREEYLLDVETMRIEIADEDNVNADFQNDMIQKEKNYINSMVESHVTNDPNNDVDRLNVLVELEDVQVVYINASNENSWDQEDEVMNTKVETELLVDDIAANRLSSDIPRTENIEIVENINISYDNRDTKNANDQYDVNIDAKTYTEEMLTEIEINNQYNDIPRLNAEVYVENRQVEFNDVDKANSADQNNVVLKNDDVLEEIEITIDKKNVDMNADREGYEEVLQEVDQEINDYGISMNEKNVDNTFDSKEYTETMVDDKNAQDLIGDKKSVINADKTADAIDDHIKHVNDKDETNNESLEDGEDYIELIKSIDPRNVTPGMQNELGQKFPEGVTQESFEINDSNGLLKAYVVRRVVVLSGVGTVYERTQTRYGATSYTRNGEPISEYQWSDETSGLTRN